MEAVQGIIAGLATGVFITLIPGMLNMQVVATSLRVDRQAAYRFSAGLALAIAAQATLAVVFADLLVSFHLISGIREYAFPILAVLALGFTVKGYFARKARHEDREQPYHGDPFWRGLGMSAMNILNIPFIFAIAGFMVAHDWLTDSRAAGLTYIPAVATGAFSIFWCYGRLANWIDRRAAFFTRNIYFFVGGLLGVLAVVQALRG